MRDVVHFISSNSVEFIISLCAASAILLVYSITLSRRLSAISKRRGQKPPGETVGEITDCLKEHSQSLADLSSSVSTLSARLDVQQSDMRNCIQRVGLVRFNAFDDVGGEQSFALVLLDGNGNGVAISSIYGRQDSRLYAKAITNADGERPLSDEERQALNCALSGSGSLVEARHD